MKMKVAQDPAFREERERKEKVEMEMREVRQAARDAPTSPAPCLANCSGKSVFTHSRSSGANSRD